MNYHSISNALDALVPITRFNKGEASKVFDEVKESGCKVVVKNNVPTCVLLAPDKYKELIELIEDQYLLALAEERERNDTGETYTFEEVLAENGLTLADLDAIEDVEIE